MTKAQGKFAEFVAKLKAKGKGKKLPAKGK